MYPHPSPAARPAQPASAAIETPRARFTQVPTALLGATALPPGARLLYGLLRAYAWQDPTCRPRQAQLAQDLAPGTSVRTVQRLLELLRAGGWITIARVGTHCQYTCLAPLPPGGFVQIPTVVLRDGCLSYGARVLYGLLLGYSRRAGRCFPGQDRLAADLGTPHTRTVRRLLAELAAAELLTWTRGGRGRANCYHLLPVAPELGVERPALSSTASGRRPPPACPPATDSAGLNAPPPSAESDASESDPESNGDSKAQNPRLHEGVPAAVRRQIQAYVADLARELGDCAPLASSVSRAVNLYTRSGLPLDAFCAQLLQARRITQRYAASVRPPQPAGEGRGKNKMPYFFAVLVDQLAAAARRDVPSPPAPLPTGEGSYALPRPVHRPAGRGGEIGPHPPAPRPVGAGRHAPAVVNPPLPYSPLIAGMALEAAQALREARPHQAAQEALALWWESGLREGAFVACMTQARAQTRPAFGASTPFRDALRRLVVLTPGR